MSEDDDTRPGEGGEPSSDRQDTPPQAEVPDLAQTLLHSRVARDDKPGRRWAYPLWLMAPVSAFILFHTVVLLVHNLPTKGLATPLHKWFDKHLDMGRYMRATGSTQSWAMFAPNPHRSNIFMRVEVLDHNGDKWDLKHDIYGRRSYPYLWYDRGGKINRRIVDQAGYRRHYAAWVCRTWEREHGVLPDEVQFVKLWTSVPTPKELLRITGGKPWLGYDPMKLHLNEREEDAIRCKTTRHGQLPNEIRARHGMEPMPDKHFLDVHDQTWVDRKREEAEEGDDDKAGARKNRRKAKK